MTKQSRRGRRMSRSRPAGGTYSILFAGVGQIVEEDTLAVAIHPGRDDAEAVEAGADLAMPVAEGQAHSLFAAGDGDLALTVGGRGGILQGPVASLAVGVDAWLIGAFPAAALAVNAINGTEEKPFAAGRV